MIIAMNRDNRCVPDAWVIGASHPLPSDPTQFDWPGRVPVVGCNQLVCLVCNQPVKARDGFDLSNGDVDNHRLMPERAKQLYERDDWSGVDGVSQDAKSRLYTCSCFSHAEFQALITFDPTYEDLAGNPSRHLRWTCAGHPALELPFELRGTSIADVSQLAVAIIDAAKDATQKDVVRGLYYRTQNGSLDSTVPDALEAAAVGPGPLDDAMTTLFVNQTNLAPLNVFVEELTQHQARPSKPDSVRREQIVDILSAAVWQRPGGVPETGTIELLREEARQGVVTLAQLRMFEVHDRDWLMTHVVELLCKRPDRAGSILVRTGRAMLEVRADAEVALQTLVAAARKAGIALDTLVSQARSDTSLVMSSPSTKRVVEALQQMSQAGEVA